jgi:predicted RNA binding protein YcfA (HicA-like mRNA interferase family)
MLPVIQGKELVTFLETLGFTIIRQRGSHIRDEVR